MKVKLGWKVLEFLGEVQGFSCCRRWIWLQELRVAEGPWRLICARNGFLVRSCVCADYSTCTYLIREKDQGPKDMGDVLLMFMDGIIRIFGLSTIFLSFKVHITSI